MKDFKPVIDELVTQLRALTGQSAEQVGPFVRKHGPLAARWEAERKAAMAAGNAPLAKSKERSRRHAVKAAVLEAATLGVNVQAAGEAGLVKAFDLALALV